MNCKKAICIILALALVFMDSLLLFPKTVNAQEAVRVAVLGLQPAVEEQDANFVAGVKAYLAGKSSIAVVDDSEVNRFLTRQELKRSSEGRASIRQGEVLFKKGRKAYEQLKGDEAVRAFEAALRSFEKGFEYLEQNKYLLMTHLYLGMSKMLLKQKKAAKEDIRRMIVLDANRKKSRLNQKFFPPDIIKIYDSLKQDVIKQSNETLEVVVSEEGARVLLDGARVGLSPVKVSGLSQGEHRITVYKRGYKRWSEKVVIKAGDNKVTVPLKRDFVFTPVVRDSGLLGVEPPVFKEAGTELNADVLLLADYDSEGRVRGQLYSVRSAELSKIEVISVDSSDKAKQRGFRFGKEITAHLNDNGDVIPEVGAPRTRMVQDSSEFTALPTEPSREFDQRKATYSARLEDEESTPFYKTWWFWSIVGGAAVVGGGVLLLSDSFQSAPAGNVLVIDNPTIP